MQLSATSGQGNGSLSLNVARNELPSVRSGAVVVNDQRLTLSQEARPCTFELNGTSAQMSSVGGRGSIGVSTLTGCTWTASATVPWIRLVTSSGSGNGSVEFEVSPNEGPLRQGNITVANRQFVVSQDAAGGNTPNPTPTCPATVTPGNIEVPLAGGSATVSLTIAPTCDWTASASASWVSIASAAAGRGNATILITVPRNTGAERTAVVTVALQRVTVHQPAAPACTVTLDSASASYPPIGGEGHIRVTTPDGCEWTASISANASWTTLVTGRGTGSGDAHYRVAANTLTSTRSATILIGGQSHTVTQQAAACTYTLDPPSRSMAASGGTGTVKVNTQQGCQWSVSSVPVWATISGGQGTGSGEFSYNVQTNSATSARSATLSVQGQNHTITQAGVSCSYTLQPASRNFAATGGPGSFLVSTSGGCQWTATTAPSGAGWVTLNTTSGNGSQDVTYAVQGHNANASRSTTITVNGQVHTITQDAAAPPPCTYTLAPGGLNFTAAGGEGRITVTTQGGCSWTASTTSGGWTSVTSGSGSGPGEVVYTVQENTTTSTRATSVTVNGQSHTVTQDAGTAPPPPPPCTYRVDPASRNFTASGGEGGFSVATEPNCQWSTSGGAGWISMTGGSGTGPGNVVYSVQANAVTASRSVTFTVNGQSHTVTQEAAAAPPPPPPCTYRVDPASRNFTASGGEGGFSVATEPNCQWSTSGGAGWISMTGGSGTGPGNVVYSVQANSVTASRSVTFTVNGQSQHTVTQDAAVPLPPPPPPPCDYSISPGEQTFLAAGGQGTITVTTGPSCPWSVSGGATWATLTSGSGGTGSGEIKYQVAANADPGERTAIFMVQSRAHTVRQRGTTP